MTRAAIGHARYGLFGAAATAGRDRYLQASRIGNYSGLALAMALAAWLVAHPGIAWPPPAGVPERTAITVSMWEAPEEAPVDFGEITAPEPIPEPAPMPDFVPPPEPERVAEPVPAKKPPPPRPKVRPRAQPAPGPASPQAAEAAVPAAPVAQADRDKFVAGFLRLVERSKFYPGQARRDNLTGTVRVRVSFSPLGEITGVSLAPGDYDPVLGQAALATMEKVRGRWKARPGAPGSLVVPIAFRLR